MKDFAIYTVIVGGYDQPKQPIVVDDRFDYILFTDDTTKKSIGVWQLRPIKIQEKNLFQLSRYPKVLPTEVLPEYKASLYIDGTLQIADQWVYERFFELYSSKYEWAGIQHFFRNCLYEEMHAIIGTMDKSVHDYDCIEWYTKLKREGFPSHYGLYENNVIFRKHSENISQIGITWWDTLKKQCKRDQFSLMYIFWKKEIPRSFFLPKNEDAKHSKHFIYTLHQKPRTIITSQNMKFHEYLRFGVWGYTPWNKEWFGKILDHAYKIPFPKISLYLWEIYALFRYFLVKKVLSLFNYKTLYSFFRKKNY